MKTKTFTVLILAICVGFLLTRLPELGFDFTNNDAFRWHTRSQNFAKALKNGDFAQTYQRYHPGVTLMWLNSAVIFVTTNYQTLFTHTGDIKTLQNADYFPILDGISRGELVLVLLVLLLVQIFTLEKLFNKKVALFYGALVVVEPYMIGINRWFHLTSLEVFFGFTSLLLAFYWHKFTSQRALGFSAVFLALAILTKMTALITLPVLLVVFASKYAKTKKLAVPLLFAGITLVTIFVLFPALWVDPLGVYHQIYNHVFLAVTDNERAYMLPMYIQPIYYLVILALKLSPLTLLLFLFALAQLVRLHKTTDFYIKLSVLAFAWYYVLLSITEQKIDRYALALVPFVLVICAYTLADLSKKVQILFGILALLFIGFISWQYFPMYSAYYSPLFGGTRTALKLSVYENDGAYFSNAAFYLNTKGRDKNVYVPDNFEAFSSYYKGNAQRELDATTDYVVTSLDIDRLTFDGHGCSVLAKTFGNRELQVVAVYSCK